MAALRVLLQVALHSRGCNPQRRLTRRHLVNCKTFVRQSSGMELKSFVQKLETFAPPSLAESWDNVGLLLEPSEPLVVKKILLTNDLTENVMEEAVRKSVNLILSYHPPLFKSIKKITQSNWKDRIVIKCLENRIAVYSPHTSFDIVQGGVNDWLLSCFHGDVFPITVKNEETGDGIGRICKLEKPQSYEETISKVKEHLGLKLLRVAYPIKQTDVKKVTSIACCAGSGASVLSGVLADVYLTGELSHHEILDAVSNGHLVILCEHSNTERGYLKLFASTLNRIIQDKVEICISEEDRDPVTIL